MTHPTTDDLERAAQLWCLPQNERKEMDAEMATSIASLLAEVRAEERERKTQTEGSAERDLLAFSEQIERLAFKMPAPNDFTPMFVMLAQQMQASAHKRLAFNHSALRSPGKEGG